MSDWIELSCLDSYVVMSVKKCDIRIVKQFNGRWDHHVEHQTAPETIVHIVGEDEPLRVTNPHYDQLMQILRGDSAPEEEPQGRQPRRRQVAEVTLREQIVKELDRVVDELATIGDAGAESWDGTIEAQKNTLSNIHKLVHADSSDTA